MSTKTAWGTLSVAAAALAWLIMGCGGTVVGSAGSPEGGSDAPAPPGPCGAHGECAPGSTCLYPIGTCAAKGQCIENPSPGAPICKSMETVCGCGSQETTGCGYPDGYASGPAVGPCAEDGGGGKPEAGTNLGPCGDEGQCPAGAGCFFPIGSCDAVGACIVGPSGGGCGVEESLCGCGGGMVTTGCGFPDGYASGPTTGMTFCTADAGVSKVDASAH
jgi:hypothetical protein